jgi:hypothetical protein
LLLLLLSVVVVVVVVVAAATAAEVYFNFLQKGLPLLTRQDGSLQQDGAPPHFGRQVTAFLNQHFPDPCIGRGGPVA